MKPIRSLGFILMSTFIVVTGNPQICAAEICNRVVAIVNDDVITLYELNQKMKELTGAEPISVHTSHASPVPSLSLSI